MDAFKTSIEYHDALDRREAQERAEREEAIPTYDEILNGAKLTDENRAQLSKWFNEKYDCTPIPSDMPIIDMDNIEEIPF